MVQILLKTLNGSTRCFELPPGSSVFDLKAKIAELEGIPLAEQRLISNDIRGISFAENYNYRFPHTSGSIFVTLALSLLGGKGGFGSLLRGGPQGVRVKKITNYDSCRDLETGRRLKYVNQEEKLAKWFAAAAQRDEEARKKREEKLKLKEEEDRLKAFDAETFAKQSEEIREDVISAVNAGLKAVVRNHAAELNEKKRRADKAAMAPSKKSCLWTEFDVDDEDENENDDADSSKKSQKHSATSTPKATTRASSTAHEQAAEEPAAEEKLLHEGASCDVCNGEIRGIRYRCQNCDDFDVCEKCMRAAAVKDHPADHIFVEFVRPVIVVGDDYVSDEEAPETNGDEPVIRTEFSSLRKPDWEAIKALRETDAEKQRREQERFSRRANRTESAERKPFARAVDPAAKAALQQRREDQRAAAKEIQALIPKEFGQKKK